MYNLTEEQQLLQTAVREFVRDHIEPIAEESDRTGEYPAETMKKLAEMDLLAIPYPAEYGGAGADYVSYVIAIEEISRACPGTATVLMAHTLMQYPIYKYGTPEQKAKFLPRLAKLQDLGAFALTEPNAGTDAGSLQTTARLEGDYWILNGSKTFITNGDMAGITIVLARTSEDQGTRGISCFIVEKGVSDYTVGRHEDKMGIRASHTTELFFKNTKVPKENQLGPLGRGFAMAMEMLAGGRIGVAAAATGCAQGLLDEAIKYSKERKQFGRPLCSNQAIQWMIADMAAQIHAARLLTYNAARNRDKGSQVAFESSAAKLFASEMVSDVAIKAVQIHGGYGYCKGFKVERLFRDQKIMSIFEGSSEVQRMVISGLLLS